MAVIYDGQGQGGILILISERHTAAILRDFAAERSISALLLVFCVHGLRPVRRHTDLDAKLRNKSLGTSSAMWPPSAAGMPVKRRVTN